MTDVDDDVPIDRESAATVAAALREASPTAKQIVDRHEHYFEEVLSTVLLAEVGRWYQEALVTGADAHASHAVAVLDELYARGDDALETVIATGFLEALPHPDDPDRWVVDRLPPSLRAALEHMEQWQPGA